MLMVITAINEILLLAKNVVKLLFNIKEKIMTKEQEKMLVEIDNKLLDEYDIINNRLNNLLSKEDFSVTLQMQISLVRTNAKRRLINDLRMLATENKF